MQEDMFLKGWLPTDLAKRARISDMTVSRFLRGKVQTAPTAKKLARALGQSVQRYLISARQQPTPELRPLEPAVQQLSLPMRRETDRPGAR
jgi:transcriptional regulator with XRE-family HTH domain